MSKKNKHSDIDHLLNGIFSGNSHASYYPLNELFENRLKYLDISKHHALKILGLDHKTLAAFLSGDSRKVDFVTILKFADFLEISHHDIVDKYFQLVSSTHNESLVAAKKRSFIINNFNLPALKKIGLIESINDFDHIEARINNFFGYSDILEYGKHKINAVFSSAKKTTNKENLTLWLAAAKESLEKTPNPNEFDRHGLVEYFPQIRWHSMNPENGLLAVAQALFKLGVTLIIVPKFTTDLHIRGATLPINDKPCIVLTKYTEYYATLWFALIHELFHVLYDWEEVQSEQFHVSGETDSLKISEREADKFARQYLLADEKMKALKPHIDEPRFVQYFAEQNHVHPSIIYSFYCWEAKDDKNYARYKKQMTVNFKGLMDRFQADAFLNFTPIKQISKERNLQIYNTI